ncbi:MAG: TrbC/VirB2 family protein [Candidatus Pacebacteria bacterium]|nr:TrbC/VirB2 family protein [Candidatus Paceibacterota bacterium]
MSYNENKMKKNFIKRGWYKIILAVYVLIIPIISFAGDTDGTASGGGGKIVDPLGGKFPLISDLIQAILQGVIKIGMPIVALAIIYCGFLFVKAQGKPTELTKAKDALLYTLIGAAILLGAWAIAKMISATVLAL